MGIRVTITESLIAKVIGARRNGLFMVGTNKKSGLVSRIHSTLYEGRESEKTIDMRDEHMVMYKMILMCFMPREGSTEYMSRDHKTFMTFMVNKYPINLPSYIFNYMCTSINEGIKGKRMFHIQGCYLRYFIKGN